MSCTELIDNLLQFIAGTPLKAVPNKLDKYNKQWVPNIHVTDCYKYTKRFESFKANILYLFQKY